MLLLLLLFFYFIFLFLFAFLITCFLLISVCVYVTFHKKNLLVLRCLELFFIVVAVVVVIVLCYCFSLFTSRWCLMDDDEMFNYTERKICISWSLKYELSSNKPTHWLLRYSNCSSYLAIQNTLGSLQNSQNSIIYCKIFIIYDTMTNVMC